MLKKLKYKFWAIRDTWYDIKYFFKNIYTYRNGLYNVRDYQWSFHIMKEHMIRIYKSIYNGYEEEVSRNKKLEKIERCVYLMDCFIKHNFIELAEDRLDLKYVHSMDFLNDFVKIEGNDLYGYKPNISEFDGVNNMIIIKLAHDIEQDYWEELWDIIKGRRYKEEYGDYYNWFDGSDCRGWWD